MKTIIVSTLALFSVVGCGTAQDSSDLQSRQPEQKPRIAYAMNAALGDVMVNAARGPAVGIWTTIELNYEVPCYEKFESFNYAIRAHEGGGIDLLASAIGTRADFNGPHCLGLQLVTKKVVVPGVLSRQSIHLVNLKGRQESLRKTTKELTAVGVELQGVRSLCPLGAKCVVGGTVVTLITKEGISCVDKIAPVTYAVGQKANGKVTLAVSAMNMVDSRLVRCALVPRTIEISLPMIFVDQVSDIELSVVGGN